jgi:hypothetical protein
MWKRKGNDWVAGAIVLLVIEVVLLNDYDVYGYVEGFFDRAAQRNEEKGIRDEFRLAVDRHPGRREICLRYDGSEELNDVHVVTRVRFDDGRELGFKRHWVRWKSNEVKRLAIPGGCSNPVREILTGTASVGSKKVNLCAVFDKQA